MSKEYIARDLLGDVQTAGSWALTPLSNDAHQFLVDHLNVEYQDWLSMCGGSAEERAADLKLTTALAELVGEPTVIGSLEGWRTKLQVVIVSGVDKDGKPATWTHVLSNLNIEVAPHNMGKQASNAAELKRLEEALARAEVLQQEAWQAWHERKDRYVELLDKCEALRQYVETP